jgi:peptide/nickel transport system permease protein
MLSYIFRRFFYMIILLLAVSLLSFVIINLPPGDYVDRLVFTYQIQQGIFLTEAEIAGLRHQFGLDRSLAFQYLNWFRDILTGDFGFSFEWGRPVKELIWERIGLTMVITVCSILFSFAIAVPIGLYSAARRYSVADYVATFIGFIGLAVPNFLLALILMWLGHLYFGTDIGGLFSREFLRVGWSWAKFVDAWSSVGSGCRNRDGWNGFDHTGYEIHHGR